MVDPGTGLVTLRLALGGKDLIVKLLGPTADYLGAGAKEFTARQTENVKKIFKRGEDLLGDKIDEPGGVPPKVLKVILDHGAFAEDPVAAQYLGGVLASSRSQNSRDDRGAYFASVIGRLSVYQLRLHYVYYAAMKSLCNNMYLPGGIGDVKILVPQSAYNISMDFNEDELKRTKSIMSHSLDGLVKEGLIDPVYALGSTRELSMLYLNVTEDGVVIRASTLGLDLFEWASGIRDIDLEDFLSDKLVIPFAPEIIIPSGITMMDV